MQESLDKLVDKIEIKLCEILPLDFTLYEKNGFCEKPSDYCKYCKKITEKAYFCNKKTYVHVKEMKFV
ncbi:MAG: hypothetical protein PHV16_03690 [Candidatus Nanoarchaeia archaeon]|nr:hypothetical protein [Candidatus Nanoarchaeia archaeon]